MSNHGKCEEYIFTCQYVGQAARGHCPQLTDTVRNLQILLAICRYCLQSADTVRRQCWAS